MEVDAIGGFFEFEPFRADRTERLHAGAVAVHSGRAALEVVLSADRPRRLHVPYFACDVVFKTVSRLDIDVQLYPVGEDLRVSDDVRVLPGEALLYVNYFGVMDGYLPSLSDRVPRLIVDNCQALYTANLPGGEAVYSARKFVGVPDGGYAYTNTPISAAVGEPLVSWPECSHLLKRIDEGPEAAYSAFREHESRFDSWTVLGMSTLSSYLLARIDHASCRRRRMRNFVQLHEALGVKNRLLIEMHSVQCPLVYPLLLDGAGPRVRERLRENRVFVAMYWPDLEAWYAQDHGLQDLVENVVALPIDQRYGPDEMSRVCDVVTSL